MASVRGTLLVIVTVGAILLWILPSALREAADSGDLVLVRRYGPFVLLGIGLLNILFAANERVIAFSPAEVNFLFPGPLTRRQLLLYKILIACGASLFTGLLMAFLMRRQISSFLTGLVGMTLAVMFLQLLTMMVTLMGSTLGAAAMQRRRRVTLLVVAAVLVVAMVQTGFTQLQGDMLDIARQLERAPIVRILIVPFQVFVEAFTAEYYWPDLARWAGIGLAINVVVVALILLLDAQYLESAASASEKLYAKLERLRQGGTAALTVPSGKPRLSMFRMPRWGGVGPLAWRQLTTAMRSLRALLSVAIIFAIAVMPALFQDSTRTTDGGMAIAIGGALAGLTLFIQPLLPFDFRGDLDRIELLKSFPVPAWRLTIGQLIAPVLVVTLFQVLILGLVQVIWQQWEVVFVVIAIFVVPVNFLVFGLENLLFLTFPTRLVATTPGDLHLFGRNILLWFAKILCLGVAALVPGLAAALAYPLSGGNVAVTLAAAWFGLIADLVGLVPLVAFAFNKFDVASDIPA